MTLEEFAEKVAVLGYKRPRIWPGGEALHAGLALILADAAHAHLEAGDLETATLCVWEAEHCLDYLRSQKAIAGEW